ncbi:ABC transporter permease subunit [Arthrobacter sp. Br18]|uniref:ABC transporter permease n=1 Tax=Arthrobacter sp. Br18 TaxID=1312954 RepID=UPI00047BBDA4|nr:ABC transporter permease subunit [Arthrobacter sp. Br18]
MSTEIDPRPLPGRTAAGKVSRRSAIGTVFWLEMRQRLRARGWYIMLAIWFVVIGLIFVLAHAFLGASDNVGPILFDMVVGFVLFFGLLVAPGLSANAVNGDRAAGTLAILQVTLLTPGQLLVGKWLASWAGSLAFLVVSCPFIFWALALGGVQVGEAFVSLGMLAVELGLIAAIGVGVSALANRPLFSIVITYMLVAMLTFGTLIVFALTMPLVSERTRVTTSYQSYSGGELLDSTTLPDPADFECVTETFVQDVPRTERTAWLLAANPFVVVADAVPYARDQPDYVPVGGSFEQPGVLEAISQGVRGLQAGPDNNVTCDEIGAARDVEGQPPIWPLGIALQGLLAGGLLLLGRKKLTTPASRLAPGTRIA